MLASSCQRKERMWVLFSVPSAADVTLLYGNRECLKIDKPTFQNLCIFLVHFPLSVKIHMIEKSCLCLGVVSERQSSSCSSVFPSLQQDCSPLYRSRSCADVSMAAEHMELCCPLTSSTRHQRATPHCLATHDYNEDDGNYSTDVVRAADFVNCSSFYANIYPSKINNRKVGSLTNAVLSLASTKHQFLQSSSLPDLPSATAETRCTKQLSPDTDDEEVKVMISSLQREEQLSNGADDALVDSRLFECCEKQRSNSSSSNSSIVTYDNNKDDNELCNDEDCGVEKGKTNSLQCVAADHTHILSSQGELRVAAGRQQRDCLNMRTCDDPQQSGEQERPDEQMMTTHIPPTICTQKRACSISPLPTADGEYCYTVKLPGHESESAQVIDVEKEEEMLREASMVSKGLNKNKDETPPPAAQNRWEVITIEDVSDEEFSNKNNNITDDAAVDFEAEVKDELKRDKKIPKLNLDDPLLKGFGVALDKISLNKRSGNGSTGDDLVSDTSIEDAIVGDDPITKRAIERLERKLKEVLKANTSSSYTQPNASNSWPTSKQRFEKESNRPNGTQDGEVVQLRKHVVRTPVRNRLSARQSSCISPIEEVDLDVESAAEVTNGPVNETESRKDAGRKPVNDIELGKVVEPEKDLAPLKVVVPEKAKTKSINSIEIEKVVDVEKDVEPGKGAQSLRVVEPPKSVDPVKVSEPLKVFEEAQNTEVRAIGEKSVVTLEVKAAAVNGHTTQPSLQSDGIPESLANKGIYKATFITPILRRKASPPRSYLEAFKTNNDDEPLDLRSYRSSHSERVFSVPSSPIWPSFSSRLSDSVRPMSPRVAQQVPISSFDYGYRPNCLPIDRSRMSPGVLRNERLLPTAVGMTYSGQDRLMNTSPHQIFTDNDWRFGNMDMNNFPQYTPAPFEPLSTEPYGLDENMAGLSSARVTSRRPLHAREQLRVYTDPVSPHRSHFRTESGDFKSGAADQTFSSSFRNYTGQDAMDPIARKAIERFDCCTTNSPRTFVSSAPPTALNSGYNTYQDPIVRSAVMRMDNQLAAAYTPGRRSDYPNSLGSRRSSINYMDACDAVPDGSSQLLSMREDGTSSSMATLSPKPPNGIRSREGSAAPPSLVDQLENRSSRGLRHIFNYLEDNDYKLSHSQTTLKQTPSRQYFSTSREYTRPKVRPGESISSDHRQNEYERSSCNQSKPSDSINFDIRLRSPTPPKPVFTDKLPPKNASDRKDISSPLSDRQQYLRGSSSYSNLYIPKDVQEDKDSPNVDYDFNEITSSSEGQQPSSSARSTPVITTSDQSKGRGVEVSAENKPGKRSQQRRSSEFSETADRCRSLERTSSRSSIAKSNRVTGGDSPRISPARGRRGLSVSASQPKSANGRSTTRPNAQESGRRKSEQLRSPAQPTSASRVKQQQHALLTRRSQTPRLSVVSTPKPEQDGWTEGRTTPLKWQMSVFERLYYNRKR